MTESETESQTSISKLPAVFMIHAMLMSVMFRMIMGHYSGSFASVGRLTSKASLSTLGPGQAGVVEAAASDDLPALD